MIHSDIKIELELGLSVQFATAYVDGRPVASVQRRRVLERNSKEWKAYALSGALIVECNSESLLRNSIRAHLRDMQTAERIKQRQESAQCVYSESLINPDAL